ncbi:MAG: AbrB/MazE/SpoVT family DNA-binding domain-containing protein [Euryarchaeota archaeon]|nr:AbrB/MazE/SpoVT family DNA-binding domain-containing protein [Euryarchaeota archaeon]
MAEATVSEKYQIQIPKEVREKLGIERGDKVIFQEKDDMLFVKVKKLPKNPVANIDGILEGLDLKKLKARATQKLLKNKLGLV